MPSFGPIELIIILMILTILFGAGRIGKIGSELGQSIREFRKGVSNDNQVSQTSDDLAQRH